MPDTKKKNQEEGRITGTLIRVTYLKTIFWIAESNGAFFFFFGKYYQSYTKENSILKAIDLRIAF